MTIGNGESTGQPRAAAGTPLAELESLIGELNEKVAALREQELDADGLQQRLRELNALAARAADALDRASR